MPPDTADNGLGRALEMAAQRRRRDLPSDDAGASAAAAARSLLARLGVASLAAGEDDANPAPGGTDWIDALRRLRSEHRHLARLARVRHPAYDLDRHIAVRRLVAAMDPQPRSLPGSLAPRRPR